MDVSVQYADHLKEDLIGCSDWVQLWGTSKRGSDAVDSLVAELGSAFEDALVLLSSSASDLEDCEVCLKLGNITSSSDKYLTEAETNVAENAVLPCSELNSDVLPGGKDKALALNEGSCKTDSPQTAVKPFSAMKGSREKRGLQVGGLSVSWDPDVYDPPTTSQSHTVNNQRYSMPSKKNHRHKHKHKGKSSSRSSNRKSVRSS